MFMFINSLIILTALNTLSCYPIEEMNRDFHELPNVEPTPQLFSRFADGGDHPIVGLGIYTPVTNIIAANARAKAAAGRAVINTKARAIKAHTDFKKSLLDAKMRAAAPLLKPTYLPNPFLGSAKPESRSPFLGSAKPESRLSDIHESLKTIHDFINKNKMHKRELPEPANMDDMREAHLHHHHGHSHSSSFQHPSMFGTHTFSHSHSFEPRPESERPKWDAAKFIPHFAPNQITINNQENTFTNVAPTQNSQTFQISQTNGHATSNQAQNANKHAAPFRREDEANLQSPFIIDFPRNSAARHAYHAIAVRSIRNHNLNKKVLLHMKRLCPESKNYGRKKVKRSLPLVKLAVDPNAKLDVTKTLDNIGAIVKNSFDDKRQPIYHVKNMVGAAKNAALAALKIAPQDIIIPSDYRIVNTKEEVVMKPQDLEDIKQRVREESAKLFSNNNAKVEEVAQSKPPQSAQPLTFFDKLEKLRNARLDLVSLNMPNFPKLPPFSTSNNIVKTPISENGLKRAAFDINKDIVGSPKPEDDPFNFLGTFKKVGVVLRDSLKSGQDTLNHINDVAHSARKVYTTARLGAPRALLPMARAPVLQREPSKLSFLAPRFLDVEKEDPTLPEGNKPTFVKVGDIMDAFGVSNPNVNPKGFTRITLHRNDLPNTRLQSRFGEDDGQSEEILPVKMQHYYLTAEHVNDNDLDENSWSDIKRDLEMVKDITTTTKEHVKRSQTLEDAEMNDFLTDMFSNMQQREQVGAGLQLPDNLWRPFMNQPSHQQLHNYFRSYGDDMDEVDDMNRRRATNNEHNSHNDKQMKYLQSINPLLFKKLFNETLVAHNGNKTVDVSMFDPKGDDDKKVGSVHDVEGHEANSRTSMHFHPKIMKPYMGKFDSQSYYYYQ